MPPPVKHPIKIAPEYIAELRARVEALGETAVARSAGMARVTVWRTLAPRSDRRPTTDAIERIRRAVTRLDPQGPPVPPPLVPVRGRDHHAWIAMADEVTGAELSRAVSDPDVARELIAAIKRRRR